MIITSDTNSIRTYLEQGQCTSRSVTWGDLDQEDTNLVVMRLVFLIKSWSGSGI